MSGWRADSEVSRLNRQPGGGPFPVSAPLAEVVAAALRVNRASGGAFDITVAPLLALFGFGPEAAPGEAVPDAAAVEAARARSGPDAVRLVRLPDGATGLLRTVSGVALDLSAIAKGYAVDRVAALLEEEGHAEHLVEIGGEIRVAGAWTVGVEAPAPLSARQVARSYRVADLAVATSGGYRDFREASTAPGRAASRPTHILDPRVGRPVERPEGSVTVLADTCLEADAWATALFVLGPDEGLALADRLGLAALFLVLYDGGEVTERASPAFASRTGAAAPGADGRNQPD